MKDYKKAIRYAGYTLGREKYNSGLYLALFLLASFAIYVYRGYGKWLQEAGEYVNLWEPYLWFQSSRACQIVFLFASVYIGYQTVSVSYSECYAIVRMSRSAWALSRGIHLIVMIFVCNMVLLASTWLACAGRISVQNNWSHSAVMAAQYGVEAVGAVPVVSVSYGVIENFPWVVGMWAFGLSSLSGIFTGFLLVVFTLAGKFAWGMVGVGILWYAGVLIFSEPIFASLRLISPYDLSRVTETTLGYGDLSVIYSALFLFFVCMVLGNILMQVCWRMDFIKLG